MATDFEVFDMPDRLEEPHHELMDRFITEMHDAIKSGYLSRSEFVEGFAYVMTALDGDHQTVALDCFERGPSAFRSEAWRRAPLRLVAG